ncbi:MAG: glutathione-regulated potassium-efflux system protein [Rhodothalassiaceae bacterium]|nr:MAG: glutathione-regulated potassium-efflux system protein [Rhodothalassiaceae bacterium]
MNAAAIEGILLLLLAGMAVMLALAARFRAPPILAYLAAGLLLGPGGLGLIDSAVALHGLAELGVILLLFMIGLEFSLPRLLAARRAVFAGGGLQVAITGLAAAAIAIACGVAPAGAAVIAGMAAMSSTALVLKQLADQGELASHPARFAIGVLLFQDLAALPFLAYVGAAAEWDRRAGGLLPILGDVVLALAFVAVLGYLLRPAIRQLLIQVARLRSRELFLISALLLAAGAASLAHLAGLSPAIGAFLAGMVAGESDVKGEIEEDIRPFRDLFLGIFFVTIGMQVDLGTLAAHPGLTFALLAGLILLKAAVILAVGAIIGSARDVSLRAALILAHGGEFSLLIGTQGAAAGLLPADLAQTLLLAVTLSLMLAPIFILASRPLVARLFRGSPHSAAARTIADLESHRELDRHVLVIGAGRVGRVVGTVLKRLEVDHLLLEADFDRFRQAQRLGLAVIYGDGRRSRVLDAAGIARARLLVITFDDPAGVAKIITHARRRQPQIEIYVSLTVDEYLPAIRALKPTAVYPEAEAAGLALADAVLAALGRSARETMRHLQTILAELGHAALAEDSRPGEQPRDGQPPAA